MSRDDERKPKPRPDPPAEIVAREPESTHVARDPKSAEIVAADGEPPVVARLVVEIRSDGSRTIARGALEDLERGQRVAVKAEGTTPLSLAASLAKSLFTLPALGRSLLTRRGLLTGRKKR